MSKDGEIWGLFSLEKRRLREDIVNIDQYFKGGHQKEGTSLSSVVPIDRTSGNEHKPEHKKLHLNMRSKFFNLRVLEHWNRLPRGVWRHSKPWTCSCVTSFR